MAKLKRSSLPFLLVLLAGSVTYGQEVSGEYPKHIGDAKQHYPFAKWQTYPMEQYTNENCQRAEGVFDDLISGLANLGEHAPEEEKVRLFRIAVTRLNKLHDETGVIETWEREELCQLIDDIGRRAGLDPSAYADGAGLADLWRTW